MNLGLTGGIGCGKSTVVELFQELGWKTLQSDLIVRGLLAENENVIQSIREHWGAGVFDESGIINRKTLAQIVFSSESELKELERILHPQVRSVWKQALVDEPGANWLIEIPLLFEKSLESEFDFVVCVHSPERTVDRRMTDRGYSVAEVKQRRQRQMPLEDKVRRADYVLTNAGNLEFLKQQSKRLSHYLLSKS